MKIDYLHHRYHISGIADVATQKQKAGIAGYSKCLGWLLQKLKIAILVSDDRGHKFYLNCQSARKFVNRHQGNLPKQAKNVEIIEALRKIVSPIINSQPKTPPPKIETPASALTPPQKKEQPTPIVPIVDQPPSLPPQVTNHEEEVNKDNLSTIPEPAEKPLEKPALNVIKESEFPKKKSSDQEIIDWVNQTKPKILLENFNRLMDNFSKNPVLPTILPMAFKSICQAPDIKDQDILEMMRKVRSYELEFSKYLAPKLSQEEWKRLVVCWDDNISFGVFDKMRSILEDPTFLFAFYPMGRTWRPYIDLFKLSKAQPLLIDKALDAYYQSPHYKANGLSILATFPVKVEEAQAKEDFINLVIEKAGLEQLLDLSLENYQSERLKQRMSEIPLTSYLDLCSKALKGLLPVRNEMRNVAAQLEIEKKMRDEKIDMFTLLPTLNIEQSAILFHTYCEDRYPFYGRKIIDYFKEKPEKLAALLCEIAAISNQELISRMAPIFEKNVVGRKLLPLYEALGKELKQAFVFHSSNDQLSKLIEGLLHEKKYDLISEILTLKSDELKEFVKIHQFFTNPTIHLFHILQHHYAAFKGLLALYFKEIKDSSVRDFCDFADMVATYVPNQDLLGFIQLLKDSAPYYHFQLSLFAAKDSEDTYIKVFNEVSRSQHPIFISNLIQEVCKSRPDLTENLLLSLAKASKEDPYLKDVFAHFCHNRIITTNRLGILENLVPSLQVDLQAHLIHVGNIEDTGNTILKILITKLDKETLSKVIACLDVKKDILNKHAATGMRSWSPEEFAKLFSVCGKETFNDYGIHFFGTLSIQKQEFFSACAKLYSDNDLIAFNEFLNGVEPSLNLVESTQQLGQFSEKQLPIVKHYLDFKRRNIF